MIARSEAELQCHPSRAPERAVTPEGVHLRWWRSDDADALARAWTDDLIVRFSEPPANRDRVAARRWIEGDDRRRRSGVSLDYAIVGIDDRVVGEVGLSGFDWSRPAAQVGFWVSEESRGSGLATAATRWLASWFLERGGALVVARCHPDNAAAHRVVGGAGLARERTDPTGFVLFARRETGVRDVRQKRG